MTDFRPSGLPPRRGLTRTAPFRVGPRAFFLYLSCPEKGRYGIGVYYGISNIHFFREGSSVGTTDEKKRFFSPSHAVHDTPSVRQLQALFPNLKAFLKKILLKRRFPPIRRITPAQSHAHPKGCSPMPSPAWRGWPAGRVWRGPLWITAWVGFAAETYLWQNLRRGASGGELLVPPRSSARMRLKGALPESHPP